MTFSTMGAAGPKPKQPPPPRGCHCDSSEARACVVGMLLFVCYLVLPPAFIIFSVWVSKRDPPEYSLAITAASGLDCCNAAAALDPEFNVTVRVTSRSQDEACLDPATSVQISYLRVPLAGGRVRPTGGGAGGLCAPPWKHADHAVVARGKEVTVPGYLLHSLAEDMRTGDATFQVTLMSPYRSYWNVYTCWGKVGDAAALGRSCAGSSVHADVMPVPQSGGHGDH